MKWFKGGLYRALLVKTQAMVLSPLAGDKRGSSAIILSVMVSGSVLATIFYNQQNLQWALSSQADSKVNWSDHFVKKYSITLGSYLVANNLILCKEGGWDDGREDEALCKWIDRQACIPIEGNDDDDDDDDDERCDENQPEVKQPADFDLTEESQTIEYIDQDGNQATKEVLSYKSHIRDDSINAGEEVNFKLTLDLVNGKDTAVKGLIGEIPDYVCRDAETLAVKDGYCPSPASDNANSQEGCQVSEEDSSLVSNSICEFIADFDQDYHIVLLTVQVLDKEGNPQGELAYAGIRRPLVSVTVELKEKPNCNLACPISLTPNSNPSCRGDFQPPTGEETQSMELKIKNEGPGVLYSLSLLRKEEALPQNDDDGNEDGDSDKTVYHLTDDILEVAEGGGPKKFLLPGERTTFNDSIVCRDTFQYNFSSRVIGSQQTQNQQVQNPISEPTVTTTFSGGTPNVHAQAYMTLSYTFGSLKAPVCVNEENQEVEDKNCSSTNPDNACSGSNRCVKANIEPKRGFFVGSDEITAEAKTTTFDTVVRYVSPH